MEPDPLRVIWIVPHPIETCVGAQGTLAFEDVDARTEAEIRLDAALLQAGFEVHRMGEPAPGVGGDFVVLRVLPASSFSSLAQLRSAYERGDDGGRQLLPTLILAADADQEALVLEFVKATDDVALESGPEKVLVRRLARLADRHAAYQRVGETAYVDELTGLHNGRYLREKVFRRWGEVCRDDGRCRVIAMLDVDNLKMLNDVFGHEVGDKLLAAVGAEVRAMAGPEDIAVRIGGDEFVCLFARTTFDDAVRAADAVRLGMASAASAALSALGDARPPRWSDTEHGEPQRDRATATASAGVARCVPGVNPQEILSRADHAVYAAKAGGRNRLVTYESMREAAELASEVGEEDVRVQHFRNVTQVVTERVASLVTLMGKQLVESAQREARRDKLTQLNNRRYFDRRIAREMELARKDGRALAIAVFDLDRFGDFNHKYGIPVADQVLRIFADIAASRIRPVDWLARYGGEEFCLVMPSTLDEATTVAERVRAAVEAAPIDCPGQPTLQVTVSAGVTQFTPDMRDADAFVQRASEALIEAKNAGRNCVRRK